VSGAQVAEVWWWRWPETTLPRRPRLFVGGLVYHVCNRAGRGEAPFKLEDEARRFWSLLYEVKERATSAGYLPDTPTGGMDEKVIRRKKREVAGHACEAELHRALAPLAEAFDRYPFCQDGRQRRAPFGEARAHHCHGTPSGPVRHAVRLYSIPAAP
jgi:hypothetical protein